MVVTINLVNIYQFSSVQFSSFAQSCSTLCDPMNRSTPGLPVHRQLLEFTQAHVHRVGDAIQPSHPLSSLLLLTPIPPSIRVFSNESNLRMRWPKYWSFSFSISPSNEPASLVAQRLKCLPPMRETWVRSLGREDTLEKEMATHSSILAWRIPWTEEPGRLQSTGSQRVGHD